MPADEKKGITVKIDAALHAEVREYGEKHGMTMAEFVSLALDDELHPKIKQKEASEMGNMRTLAFHVPEDLFQRIKDYLQRNNVTQRQFVIGLIETELDREQAERESLTETDTQAENSKDELDTDPEEIDDAPEYGESDETDEDEAEEESEGLTIGM